MKMKKFFSNKSRKKKGPSNVIRDTKVQEISSNQEAPAEKVWKKKKGRRSRKPDREPNRTTHPLANGKGSAILASNGVVLRRPSHTVKADSDSHLRSPARRGDSVDDPRVPGSESSSRTASSASTSSHQRWSSRRPYSLAESFRGQTLEEEYSAIPRCVAIEEKESRLKVAAPSGSATLPPGMTPDYGEHGARPRTMALDFSIFRFFRRSSRSRSSEGTESESTVSLSSSGRSSFRLRDLHKSKKKKRRSTRNKLEQQTSSSSISVDYRQERSNAFIQEEEEVSGVTQRSCHSINATPTRESMRSHKIPFEPLTRSVSDSCHDESSARSSVLDSVSSECSHCHKLRHSASDEDSNSSMIQVAIVETDQDAYSTPRTGTWRYMNRPYSTPCSMPSYASTCDITSSRELLDDTSTAYSTSEGQILGASSIFGGSLNCLDRRRASASGTAAQTLPRHRSQTEGRFSHSATKTVYASLPQLRPSFSNTSDSGSSKRGSIRLRDVKSGSVRFKDGEKQSASPVVQVARSELKNTAMVDSPVKRAIAYPGVILRRQQKKHLNKSASTDLLVGEKRAKQVLSLNMEDLPTYTEMQKELQWRTTSLMRNNASGNRTATDATTGAASVVGRARLRMALMYQRYAAHSTSIDDVSAVHKMLDKHKDFYNLDDDEFLDMYLSAQLSAPSTHETNRAAHIQEPSSKRVKTLRKSVASFANLISPGKPGRSKLQRSSSFNKESSAPAFKPYRPPGSNHGSGDHGGHTPGRRLNSGNAKNRRSRLWCETFDHTGLNERELKRQEAIFELYQGENDLVQDLRMAKQTYRDSMMTLKMLSDEEVTRIFGKLDCLLPLHEDLLNHLNAGRSEDGRTEAIGHVFIDWFPTLSPYEEYCANQGDAKETLDAVVGREARVRDFLQRCLESPFSRKLDLWSYLDLPRSKLVKYPLLLKNILKATPTDHPDNEHLQKALLIINDIIGRVDDMTGERQSRFFLSKLDYLDDKQRCSYVDESRNLLCSGQLKSNRGTKLHVFLFDLALVLTRNATRGGKLTYQVYRQPLSLRSLVIDGEEGGKLSGSFRGGILSSDKAKHSFRVRDEEQGISYTLIATDEHDRKQWINSLQEAISKFRGEKASSAGSDVANPRRAASDKAVSKKDENAGSDSWRSRSMTVNSVSRSNSRERKEAEKQKKFKLGSPSSRRRSNTVVTKADANESDKKPAVETSDVRLRTKAVSSKNNPCRRSRSLTSSPIALFASLPRRSTRAALARSESCSTKPPTGRTQTITHAYNLRTTTVGTPPRSPGPLQSTRSTPDLSMSRSRSDLSTLEEVKERLEASSQEEKLEANSPPKLLSRHGHLIPNLLIDSPEHPAASDTSRCFAMVEEDSVSPLYKSLNSSPLRASSSSPVISSFILASSIQPIIAWAAPTSSPNKDEPSVDYPFSDVTPTSLTPTSEDVTLVPDVSVTNDVVSDVVNQILDQVCTSLDRETSSENVTCHGDYIIVTGDDGMPWQGDDIEMDV